MSDELKTKPPVARRGSGHLFEKVNGSGVWHIQYYIPEFDDTSGKVKARRVKEYCSLPYAEARKRLADRQGKLARGERLDVGRLKLVADLYAALRAHTEGHLISGSRKLKGLEGRWVHLKPIFAHLPIDRVTTASVNQYKTFRRDMGAAVATVNRELAVLRRMFNYGKKEHTPPLVLNVPHIALAKENNVRTGYVEDAAYERMAVEAHKEGLWLRAFIEIGYSYGWRHGEIINLRVRQIDFDERGINLDPGMTKNREGRTVWMNDRVYELLRALCERKGLDDHVFTRDTGRPVQDIRAAWQNMCVRAGVGRFVCSKCGEPIEAGTKLCYAITKDEDGTERKCGRKRRYSGLIPHDFRRSAARNLRRAGVPESVIMKTGGWKTRSMFERYNITNKKDQKDAMMALEAYRERANDPSTTPLASEIPSRTAEKVVLQ